MKIKGLKLIRTCCACPEQYEVYKNNKQVAYMRLRHGWFYVSMPDCLDEIVYEANPKGDGMFTSDERMKYLNEAIDVIISRSKK